jgi:hypothetical protein
VERPRQEENPADRAEEVPDLLLGVVEVSRPVDVRAADEENAHAQGNAATPPDSFV